MSIREINFNCNYPSVRWSDSSCVPLDTVCLGDLNDYRDKLEEAMENKKNAGSLHYEKQKEILKELIKYIAAK